MRKPGMLRVVAALAVCAAGLAALHAAADVPVTIELAGAPAALTRLFQAPAAKPEWFTPAFLAQVRIEQINAAIAGVTKRFGEIRSVDGAGLDYNLHFARGSVHARVVLDRGGLIAALMM